MRATGYAMPTSESHQADPAVLDQAIQWLIKLRFNQPDETTLLAFHDWLHNSPDHAKVWQQVAKLDGLAGLPRDIARRTLDTANQHLRLRRRDSLKLLAVLAGASSLSWLGYESGMLPDLLAEHRTGTGEQRMLNLTDGTRIQLNSNSAIDAHFDEQRRLIVLHRGEILVDTGYDSKSAEPRPLWVNTDHGHLRALGTRFLVRGEPEHTLLAVRRGAVAISPRTGSSVAGAVVKAGEQVLLHSWGQTAAPSNGLDPWAWSEGVISAHDMRLGDFIAELARYRPGVLRCSETCADLRLSGTYQLDDTDQVLALVAKLLPIRVDYRTRYWVTLTKAS